MAASQPFQVDPSVIAEIADRLSDAVVTRVVEVLRAEGLIPEARAARAWLDAQEVAQRLGVCREWVYEHAEELGASRIGTGPRPRLRFPPQVLDFPGGNPTSPQAPTRSTSPRGKTSGLIPIHGA
ncbi:MAG: helix-turn-helix domain-containing protein [Solirubrobacteraceae bacterium]